MNTSRQKIIASCGIAAIIISSLIIVGQQSISQSSKDTSQQTNITLQTSEEASSTTEPTPTRQPVVETKIETKTKEIPFDTKYIDDNTLAKGTTKITQNGANGIETTTYTVTYTDGAETARKISKVETTKKPISQIIARGTYVAPKPTTTQSSTKNCNIKGNISKKGEKIYHVPGQRYYSATVINTSAGERWFCSEAEARAAGWRKSKV